MFNAKIIADSTPEDGSSRLTTMELCYPRIIHAEFMTHRLFSRNAASSRAIPVAMMIHSVEEEPFIPIHWGAVQKGMQAYTEIPEADQGTANVYWMQARNMALESVRKLISLGLHKQVVNRLLEPFQWITVIASGCEPAWANFFHLRCHKMAEPHINMIANLARIVYEEQKPDVLRDREWHLPYISADERATIEDSIFLAKVSAARCARVSYLTHDGKRDVVEDRKLFDKLAGGSRVHASAMEHPAKLVVDGEGFTSNFDPCWRQLRKMIPKEAVRRMQDVGKHDDE